MLVRMDGELMSPVMQSPGMKGVWKDITFTGEPVEECDLIIVSNRAKSNITVRCPRGGRWLSSGEPPEGYYSYFKAGYKDYDVVLSLWEDANEFIREDALAMRKWGPTTWFASRTYDFFSALKPEECGGKQDRLSYVMSEKKKQVGHKLRHRFRDYLDSKGYPYDIFGGCKHFIKDKCQALLPYKYTVAVENSAYADYWTEKISDAFLCWCIPVYWGAPNITDYFPREAIIKLDPNDLPGSLERIDEAVRGDYWSRNFEALKEARERVLNRYQFFPFMYDLIKQHYRPQGEPELLTIPALHHPKEATLLYKIKKKLGIYALKERLRYAPWVRGERKK